MCKRRFSLVVLERLALTDAVWIWRLLFAFALGGGRSGGLNQKNSGSGMVYRRVQASSTSENVTASDGDGASSHGNGGTHGGRKVEVVNGDRKKSDANAPPPPAPTYYSSLQASLQGDPPAAPSKFASHSKNGVSHQSPHPQDDRRGGGRGGPRGGDKPKPPYGRNASQGRSSPPPKRRDQQQQQSTEQARLVTSLSSWLTSSVADNSPKKLADRKKFEPKESPRHRSRNDSPNGDEQPRQLASSLMGSVTNTETARPSDHKTQDRSRHGSNFARSNSRDVRHQQRDSHARDVHSYRKVEDSSESSRRLSEKNLRSSSFSKPLSRKNSSESITSLRSERSERSERSDYGGGSRWDRKSKNHQYGDNRQEEHRNSMGSGSRFNSSAGPNSDDIPPTGRVTRSVSDSNRNTFTPTPGPVKQAPSVSVTARSSQDVRFQKSAASMSATPGRATPEYRGRQMTSDASFSENASAPPFRSSFDSSLNRSSAQDARSSTPSQSRSSSLARSVVSDVDTTPRNSVHKSPGVSSAAVRKVSDSPVAFSSSLSKSITGEGSENIKSHEPAIDEAEQRRSANEAMKDKFEARKVERSLSKPQERANTAEELPPAVEAKREFRSGITPSAIGPGSSLSTSEKTKRTDDFFNRLKSEDAAKEAARRADGFTSSLLSSMSVKPTLVNQSRMQKTVYTLSELQRCEIFVCCE